MNIDKWAADQCGVNVSPNRIFVNYFIWQGKRYEYRWTIKDPRCREKIRWELGISTEICFDSVTGNLRGVRGTYAKGEQSTNMKSSIEEAEIACITAIYEASKND